ncbi:MAG TPA: exodeoxyribonuclease VII small subunit [Thermoanaerobaculia bacterium]|nr:exodeoxyribonuclease VII small subunit [Thermoanaerobaculia bacterium]
MSERDPSGAAPVPSFGEAMAELEEILERIEGEDVDVDGLAAELRRASELLELAREKIRRAEVEVTQIVQGIEGAAAAGPVDPDGGGDPDEDADEDADEDPDDDIPF